ncbi:hypothetical protein M758_5G086200 [Ceratodon purpureus]|nr:hypothetical protein M758_5G086200 [Ceratodon purpureus]
MRMGPPVVVIAFRLVALRWFSALPLGSLRGPCCPWLRKGFLTPVRVVWDGE